MLRHCVHRAGALHCINKSIISRISYVNITQCTNFATTTYKHNSNNGNILASHDRFEARHLGVNRQNDIDKMLQIINISSIDELMNNVVPKSIKAKQPLNLPDGIGESHALSELQSIMSRNKLFATYIGQGYYNTLTPTVILRNIIENPAWYTPYTPYQAEIAQGRLEMLLNYQTMISDLTGLPVANCSLLDESTAAAEAMNMCYNSKKRKYFLVSDSVYLHTIDVLQTRADGYGATIKVVNDKEIESLVQHKDVFGVLVQYPSTDGSIVDYKNLTKIVKDSGAMMCVASDLLALTVLQPPGEYGADVVLGSAQRFGVPVGYGGPHAAFLATNESQKRRIPGRIIGVSKDVNGKSALRMAMQTREQHIRRDKATSNICTAQALLANVSAAYAIYHGPQGLKQIGEKVHAATKLLAAGLSQLQFKLKSKHYFDTIQIIECNADHIIQVAQQHEINLWKVNDTTINVSLDETITSDKLQNLLNVFCTASNKQSIQLDTLLNSTDTTVPQQFKRTSTYCTHPVFNTYHSETEMLRYLYSLQMKDLSLATAMIPLGSCTMKLNATSEMIPITWPTVNSIHPFVPESQVDGYKHMLLQLNQWLSTITGFHTVSLQPNAGSQGEYAGLSAIKAYHTHNSGANKRNICLIPTSAHGTNPASAVMVGYKVVVVACDDKGNVDINDLKQKASKHQNELAALMVTYPSTHGVFEESISDICDIVHSNGGLVYMDGANLNAQVGLTSPGSIGADVCHMNLHKTFCIPHGGGGPGMGPIGVNEKLAPYLPTHRYNPSFQPHTKAGAIASTPFSSASILPISYMYIRMMGGAGLTHATQIAILNANYMAARLNQYYTILYTGSTGYSAHEFIIDIREIKSNTGITEEDIAKRLQDYNFHAPTMSFPVVGTLMIEPTESESLYELDRFCDAMIHIRQEIHDVESGKQHRTDNTLKNAPHTLDSITVDEWTHPYTRQQAVFPQPYLRNNKFWPTVARIDNVYGDRNVICTCPPIESYA